MIALELSAVVVTLLAVYLTARQVVWCWPLGMVSVTLYAVVFQHSKLYADMGLQAVYFALAAYGWWAWLRGGEDHGALTVTTSSRRALVAVALVGLSAGLLGGLVLHRHTDAALPFLDSTLTAFSIAAQWMQTRKLLESWLLWLVVDVCYVGMFVYKELFLTAGLYTVFLYLALLGYVRWRRTMPAREAAAQAEPAL